MVCCDSNGLQLPVRFHNKCAQIFTYILFMSKKYKVAMLLLNKK